MFIILLQNYINIRCMPLLSVILNDLYNTYMSIFLDFCITLNRCLYSCYRQNFFGIE